MSHDWSCHILLKRITSHGMKLYNAYPLELRRPTNVHVQNRPAASHGMKLYNAYPL